MKTIILSEHGYEEAMLGISLSWASNPERSKEIAPKLAHKQGGHNKFLESMMVWMDIDAPRYWWQEFDTYRTVTKQSESTMHTITKRNLDIDDFAQDTSLKSIHVINDLIDEYLYITDPEDKKELFLQIKASLPEGFLQRRIVCLSYKTLQNMYAQRKNHRLKEWQVFFDGIELEHKEFIYG